MIEGKKDDGSSIKVADIVDFSQKPSPEGLMFDIKGDGYRNKLYWVKEGQRQYVTVFGPEYGQKIQILNNLGNFLIDSGEKYQAVEVFRQAIALCPRYGSVYNGYGNVLQDIGRNEEAIEAYRKAIEIDPDGAPAYNNLGNSLVNLGRNVEAIEAYQKFIELADMKKYEYWIERGKKLIVELQR
jgi:tetratricopeptide (TPR) repeat protein